MSNATALNFGFPQTMVAETAHWLVLIRPKQPTFGSLVLVCKEPVQAFSDLSADAFADLRTAVRGVEGLLRKVVAYEKINYLMLMMVDRDVHFHVIPRYDGLREYGDQTFQDAGWPGPPALGQALDLAPETIAELAQAWRREWRTA